MCVCYNYPCLQTHLVEGSLKRKLIPGNNILAGRGGQEVLGLQMLMLQFHSFSNPKEHEEEVQGGRKQGNWSGYEDPFSNKEKCFSTCAKGLRKAKKMLRCHVKLRSGAPKPSHASEM